MLWPLPRGGEAGEGPCMADIGPGLWVALCTSQLMLVVKNLPANVGDVRDMGSIPGSGNSPGGGDGNALQYFCLENPMDGGAWQATVYKVAKSQTGLK